VEGSILGEESSGGRSEPEIVGNSSRLVTGRTCEVEVSER
jgi:hypothetical protein